ncbi:hypothetical protein CEXT_449181 [Caerostris extrusa]|uniref:Uncharacterized protein n=1 Tax=Caerostris extrusa TaxID=172846 RepID=A0AAV4XMW0_CAEEX|nr:hypothetical protein CEXT_449181 [Caerostris extrusa]
MLLEKHNPWLHFNEVLFLLLKPKKAREFEQKDNTTRGSAKVFNKTKSQLSLSGSSMALLDPLCERQRNRTRPSVMKDSLFLLLQMEEPALETEINSE